MKFRTLFAAVVAPVVLFNAAEARDAADAPPLPAAAGQAVAFRWLEEPSHRGEAERWADLRTKASTAELSATPGFQRLANRIAAATRGPRLFEAGFAGGVLFAEMTNAVWRADGPGVAAIGPARGVLGFSPSPSGVRGAFVERVDGEIARIVVRDLVSGRTISVVGQPIWRAIEPAWLDEETLLYAAMESANAPF